MRTSLPLLLIFSVAVIAGCASGPRLSGLAIGETRFVSVGDLVELRLSLRDDGSRLWRVTAYDSLYLGMEGRPQVVEGGGGAELLVRARARYEGETEVEVTEMLTVEHRRAGREPRVVRFRISIGSGL